MDTTQPLAMEESLDPQDWQAMRDLGHRMLDDMMDYLQSLRERPAWQPIPEAVKASFKQPLPREPQDPAQVYQEFLDNVLPYPLGNIHPRFWGWVVGTGTPLAMLAEMLAAAMNPNVAGGDHVANLVEAQVIEWCKEMLGYPAQASGLLLSGASMAGFVGLAAARSAMAGFDVRQRGLAGSAQQMTFYGSCELHSANQKALEMLGLGVEALRYIPVNSDFTVDCSALEAAIAQDRDAGYLPACVIGCAGTVNTGAIDDLGALADICEQEGLWFHVDGAFGALAALSPALRHLVAGMERADSLAFDMHKWMYMPYEIGCALVRREEDHLRAFSVTADYLTHAERGTAAGTLWYGEYGPQLSRGFRALKAWMSIKEHGIEKYGRLIQQNVEQARYLARLVEDSPHLELLAPVPLNIVCFRFTTPGLDDASLSRLNEEVLLRLQEEGTAVPSSTLLNGKYALRVAIVNHRSRREDYELLVREVLRLGEELLGAEDH